MQVSNAMNVKGILELMSVFHPKDVTNSLSYEPIKISHSRKESTNEAPFQHEFMDFALLSNDPYDYLSGELSEILYS